MYHPIKRVLRFDMSDIRDIHNSIVLQAMMPGKDHEEQVKTYNSWSHERRLNEIDKIAGCLFSVHEYQNAYYETLEALYEGHGPELKPMLTSESLGLTKGSTADDIKLICERRLKNIRKTSKHYFDKTKSNNDDVTLN